MILIARDKVCPSHLPIFKKRYEKFLPLFYRNIVLSPQKFLDWYWCCLNQCNVTEKNQLLFLLYLGSSVGQRQFGLGYGHKIMMKGGIYFKQEIQSNIYFDHIDILQ